MRNEIIEIYGVINTVYPIDTDNTQKIIIDNANTLNTVTIVEPRILLIVKHPTSFTIDFKVGLPITVKGIFSRRKNANYLSIIHTTHSPVGFIRYNGKIYN